MTFSTVLAFLIANGGSIVAAGTDIAHLANNVASMFKYSDTITEAEFDAFVASNLAGVDLIQAEVDKAKAELG